MANWMREASKKMEQKGTKGALHRYLGIPEGQSIPVALLRKALKKPGITETTRKRIQFALTAGPIAKRRAAHASLTPALAAVNLAFARAAGESDTGVTFAELFDKDYFKKLLPHDMQVASLTAGRETMYWTWRVPGYSPVDFELDIIDGDEVSELEHGKKYEARCRWTLTKYEDDDRSGGLGDTCDLEYSKFVYDENKATAMIDAVKRSIINAQKSALERLKNIDEDWEDQ